MQASDHEYDPNDQHDEREYDNGDQISHQ